MAFDPRGTIFACKVIAISVKSVNEVDERSASFFVKFEVPQRMPAPERGPSGVQVKCAGNMYSQCSPLFCRFAKFGTGEGPLVYGIDIRCEKRAPGVREAFSKALGAKNRLLRYRMEIRCKKRPSGVPDASSKARSSLLPHRTHLRKHETASCHTGRIFSARNAPARRCEGIKRDL